MSMAVMPKLATQHKSLAGGENMKTIIIEMDENKNAQLFKPDNMMHMECVSLLIGVAAHYYQQVRHIASINEATVKMAAEILQGVGSTARVH